MQGKYIILGRRKDRKSLPAALLKAKLNEALRAQLRERRGKELSREEVASLKETVKEQMLAAVSPTTNLYEAVWNFETQDVYFSAQAGKIAVEFAELFEETFGLSLTEVTLPARAEAYVDPGPPHFPRTSPGFRRRGETTRRQQDVSRRMTAWGRRFLHPSRVRSYSHGSGRRFALC